MSMTDPETIPVALLYDGEMLLADDKNSQLGMHSSRRLLKCLPTIPSTKETSNSINTSNLQNKSTIQYFCIGCAKPHRISDDCDNTPKESERATCSGLVTDITCNAGADESACVRWNRH